MKERVKATVSHIHIEEVDLIIDNGILVDYECTGTTSCKPPTIISVSNEKYAGLEGTDIEFM